MWNKRNLAILRVSDTFWEGVLVVETWRVHWKVGRVTSISSRIGGPNLMHSQLHPCGITLRSAWRRNTWNSFCRKKRQVWPGKTLDVSFWMYCYFMLFFVFFWEEDDDGNNDNNNNNSRDQNKHTTTSVNMIHRSFSSMRNWAVMQGSVKMYLSKEFGTLLLGKKSKQSNTSSKPTDVHRP